MDLETGFVSSQGTEQEILAISKLTWPYCPAASITEKDMLTDLTLEYSAHSYQELSS